MAYLTGKDLIDTLIRDIGENINDSGYRLIVLSWLNQAIDETLTLLHGFKFTELRNTFDTIIDQKAYDFSITNFYSDDILAMAVTNPKRPLQQIDYFDLVRSGVDLSQKGQPRFFYFYSFDTTKHQSLVSLWPIPSSVEKIEVYYSFSSYTVADDTTVIPLPKQVISIMMKYIKKLMYESENESTNAQAQYQEFLFMIGEIKKQKTSKSTFKTITPNDIKIPVALGLSQFGGFGFNSGLIGSLAGQTLAGVSSISINCVQNFMTQSGSPITSGGTIDLDWADQTGYKFLASPFDGSSGKPSFRKINAADIDGLTATHTQNTDTGTNSTTWEINNGGSKLILSSVGLTVNRTFTYPDVSGKVLTNNSLTSDFPTLNQNTTGNAATATTATNFSGSLSGDVIGIQSSTVIGVGKVTNTMLAGSIAYSKLSLTGAILNADLAGSIAYSKLVLTTSITNTDISISAAIDYSKLNLTGAIVNADISASAAIANSKLANSTISGVALGSNLFALTIGAGLSGSSYNGSAGVTIAVSGVTEAMQTLANNTTNDVSITKHGYAPIAPNDATKYLDGTGAWSIPAGGGGGSSVTMGGDVTGNSATCTVAKINGATLGTTTATSGNILVANVSNAWTSVAMSGDITISNAGVTAIGSSKVTNAMLAGSIAYSKLSLTGAILNADLAGSIAYSKLVLTTSIVNGDISASAAIAYSKLSLTTSIVNGDISASAAIAYSKLSLASSIVNADISASAAIAYSKLNLGTSIVNADISASAAIAYSKLNLTGAILNADLAGSISYTKLASMTSANFATVISDETGSGALVFATSPTLVTPELGAATASTSITSPIHSISDGGNGGVCNLKCLSTLKTVSSTGITTASGAKPAGIIKFVLFRFISTVAGAGTVSCGDGASASKYGSGFSRLVGTTNSMANYAAGAVPELNTAASDIIFTLSSGSFNGTGQIRIDVFYEDATAPTS